MTTPHSASENEVQQIAWKQNLYVCLFGSFTTILAMTLILPILPVYIQNLGVTDPEAVVSWSGWIFSITFLAAGLMAPVWGRFADRYGRKIILIRASLGMAIGIALIGCAQTVWQLFWLRLLVGLLGGYASGATILVATQTPRAHTGWAVGMLASGTLAGNLLGPLIGGIVPALLGIRLTFFVAGGIILLAFFCTVFMIRETHKPREAPPKNAIPYSFWKSGRQRNLVLLMLLAGTLLMFANMSVEPIITLYLASLRTLTDQIPLLAGIAMSATAFGSMLFSSRAGRWGDTHGHLKMLIASFIATAVLLLLQGLAQTDWQFITLRFLMGMTLCGIMPALTAMIRHNVPADAAGGVLGYATSTQYAGLVLGPLAGGLVANQAGFTAVFVMTGAVMLLAAALLFRQMRTTAGPDTA
ncbi:MFS transporter [Advenella sp. FME57]|uniref:MFS transporter n=1 Tax=Advenella kashmirensis TaxID=310575 RepID=A0A356LAD3_9BURK|nr:MFS transporter [Advenella sp. FME57]HBP27884.1 MFS transporter [Advenella kashmirensis]